MGNIDISIGGGSFLGLLTILFIALKLLDKIDWSWWWVLAPLWIPLTIVLIIIAGILLGMFFAYLLNR